MYRYDDHWSDPPARYGRPRSRSRGRDFHGADLRRSYEVEFRGGPAYGRGPRSAGYGRVRGYGGRYDHFAETSDDRLRGEVYRSLLRDGYLDAGVIDVNVDGGVVTLRGEVQDYMQARYAWDDAWDAPGVRGVVSRLTVAEGPDAEGEERVERQ